MFIVHGLLSLYCCCGFFCFKLVHFKIGAMYVATQNLGDWFTRFDVLTFIVYKQTNNKAKYINRSTIRCIWIARHFECVFCEQWTDERTRRSSVFEVLLGSLFIFFHVFHKELVYTRHSKKQITQFSFIFATWSCNQRYQPFTISGGRI